MEVKKSHKADLEHLRPWMFLGAFVIMALLFILVLEVHIGGRSEDFDDFDDDIAMDLNIKPNDQRDMIAAAEKTKQVGQSENLNKVDNLSDLPPEILEVRSGRLFRCIRQFRRYLCLQGMAQMEQIPKQYPRFHCRCHDQLPTQSHLDVPKHQPTNRDRIREVFWHRVGRLGHRHANGVAA